MGDYQGIHITPVIEVGDYQGIRITPVIEVGDYQGIGITPVIEVGGLLCESFTVTKLYLKRSLINWEKSNAFKVFFFFKERNIILQCLGDSLSRMF